jgi:uncharacterized coiled-coil protein SlyX
MQNSREDSVWRTLAVAFGDGLAFGVGMNLTQNAVRLAAAKVNPELKPLTERLSAIENRIDRARANGTLPSPAAIDARVSELAARFDSSLAELEVKVKIQLDGLREHNRDLAQDFGAQMEALRGQMITLHKEFAETVSRLVEEQIEAGITARMEPIQQQLREMIREEAQRASAVVAAEIERRLEGRDRNMLQLVLGLGQACLETAERMSPPLGGGAASPETTIQPAGDLSLPSFARSQPPKGVWRIPVVSSFFAVTCGLLLLHYL